MSDRKSGDKRNGSPPGPEETEARLILDHVRAILARLKSRPVGQRRSDDQSQLVRL